MQREGEGEREKDERSESKELVQYEEEGFDGWQCAEKDDMGLLTNRPSPCGSCGRTPTRRAPLFLFHP